MAGNANSGRRPGYKHLENTRQKIRASAILIRMQEDFFATHTNAGENAKKGKKRPLTALQVRIGEGLLRKVLPDLQGITLAGDADHPIVTRIVEEIVDPK